MPAGYRRWLGGVLLGLCAAGLGAGLSLLPPGRALEESPGLTWLFEWRGPRAVPPRVVLVTMDEASMERLGLPRDPDSWPRSIHARLVERLREAGAAAVIFDVLFETPRDPAEDAALAAAVARAENVVLAQYLRGRVMSSGGKELHIQRLSTPIDELVAGAAGQAPFPLPKLPGRRVSDFWTFKAGAGDSGTLPAVALQVAARDHYPRFVELAASVAPDLELPRSPAPGHSGWSELVREVRSRVAGHPEAGEQLRAWLGGAPRPDTGWDPLPALVDLYTGPDARLLDFYGPPHTIPSFSYHDVLDSRGPLPGIEGRVVFVGLSERAQTDQRDAFYTVYSQASGIDIAGVEIAATAYANLAEERTLSRPTTGVTLLILVAWGLLLGPLARLLPATPGALVGLALGGLYLLVVYQRFAGASVWYPLVVPVGIQLPAVYLSALLWRYREAHRERDHIRRLFGQYLPTPVADRLVRSLGGAGAGRHELVYGTCLLTDAEHYTNLAEDMDLTALGELMNRYYDTLSQPVRERGGFVSDVVGDSMLAIWATAEPDAKERTRACHAALDMREAIVRFNAVPDNPALPTRIGLHSGRILLGHIGGSDHFEYRAVGDIVNTTERIQSLNKRLGTRVLASGEAMADIADVTARPLGRFVLTGKTQAIEIFEPLIRTAEAGEEHYWLCKRFEAALTACRRGEWNEALGIFEAVLERLPEDGPARFYAAQCRRRLAEGDSVPLDYLRVETK